MAPHQRPTADYASKSMPDTRAQADSWKKGKAPSPQCAVAGGHETMADQLGGPISFSNNQCGTRNRQTDDTNWFRKFPKSHFQTP